MAAPAVVEVLFAASAVTATVETFRRDFFPKVNKLALAVAFAATAFFIQVAGFFK
jgi:hypothetical protein